MPESRRNIGHSGSTFLSGVSNLSLEKGLKIRVSVVRFHPGPPFKSASHVCSGLAGTGDVPVRFPLSRSYAADLARDWLSIKS